MEFEPGTRLRQYEILQAIGAGGMGEVYRAHDTNLDRDVAIKVLPASVARNATSLARLEREAKSIAALSHPNVLAVYDFGTDEDTAFVVTELLEGETLRERLEGGALPARKATDLGRQIARGLAAAHDKGIVHRDLKPENIFLTGEGRVKILDFGLATAGDPEEDTAGDDMATMTNITKPGTVLGTVNYMSPEQVRGEPSDNRSDLFSFGSVMYEMVVGTRPFARETAAETMTAILKEEPPEPATTGADVPPALAAIIRRCLEKISSERFHSAHDLAFSLEALSGSTSMTGTAAAMVDVAGPRRRIPAGAAILLLLAGLVIGAAAVWFLKPAGQERPLVRFEHLSSRRGIVTNGRFTGTDGSAVYSATWDGEPIRLFPAAPGNRTSEPLNIGPADLLSVSSTGELALSLDRRHTVGFEMIGTLALAQPGGAAPRPVLENVLTADWAPDGRSLAVVHEVAGVVRLEYPIGTVLYESPGWILSLRVNPDGDRIVFSEGLSRGDNFSMAKVVDRTGTVTDTGLFASWGVAWGPDGETIYTSNGPTFHRKLSGAEQETAYAFPGAFHLLDVDATGRVLAATGSIRREMFGLIGTPPVEAKLSWRTWSTPRSLSRDGRYVLFEEGNEVTDVGYGIYLRATDGTPPQRLGHGAALAMSPDAKYVAVMQYPFTPDWRMVVIPSGPGDIRDIAFGDVVIVPDDGLWVRGPDIPGGDGLLLKGQRGDELPRLYLISLDDSPAQPVTPADMPLSSYGHIVSDDGRRLIVNPAEGVAVEFDLEGNGPRTVAGLTANDLPLGFDADGRHIYIQTKGKMPAPINRLNLETGERVLWRELSPSDAAGVVAVDRVRVSADGSVQVYSNRRYISNLELIDGLQ